MYRIDQLLKAEEQLFHTNDLALLWGISNRNTLYTTITRYIAKGILLPIHKGFYSTVPLEKIDPLRLAKGYLHRFVYLSCEIVLFREGIISQCSDKLTLVSDKSKRFILKDLEHVVRRMDSKYLFNDLGIVNNNGLFAATPERAAADMLYFNPTYQIDQRIKINWKSVRKIQRDVFNRRYLRDSFHFLNNK